jgi:hypothetical protein
MMQEENDMETLDHASADRDEVLDVPLLDWPAESARRDALAAVGRPRLLLVAEGQSPPSRWDVLEDWVRAPADVSEVLARQATLRSRAAAGTPDIRLDEHGLLWVGPRWVPIPRSQTAVLSLLVAHQGRLVSSEELRAAYVADGGAGDVAAMKAVMVRLGRRVSDVGLRLHNLRGRGSLLEHAAPDAP